MERIEIVENGLFLVFEIADDKCFKFLHFGKSHLMKKILLRDLHHMVLDLLKLICLVMIVPMSAMETNIL